jgi:hypothetical protein
LGAGHDLGWTLAHCAPESLGWLFEDMHSVGNPAIFEGSPVVRLKAYLPATTTPGSSPIRYNRRYPGLKYVATENGWGNASASQQAE